jgi:hypothetical protein
LDCTCSWRMVVIRPGRSPSRSERSRLGGSRPDRPGDQPALSLPRTHGTLHRSTGDRVSSARSWSDGWSTHLQQVFDPVSKSFPRTWFASVTSEFEWPGLNFANPDGKVISSVTFRLNWVAGGTLLLIAGLLWRMR